MPVNKNYSVTLTGMLDTKQVEAKIKELESKKHNIKFEVDEKGFKDTANAAESMSKAVDKANNSVNDGILTFAAANMILNKTVDAISAMTQEVFALDSAMTDFKKVSDLSGESLKEYSGKLSTMGKEVARTSAEMLTAATEFRKNGFNDEDSATLALVASKFQNVADDAMTAGESASFIIAQMKAFNIEASQSEHIIDAVNAVSNNFSVSSTQLSQSLGNVSATMSQTGASMEQTLGIIVN